jgi:2-methylcitrate dehydratase PrpD
MTETTTEDLARFAASVKYENIPAPAREYCKDILLDTLACAFAGHFGEETDQIARFAKSLATSTESTVIGGDNLSLAGATLLNGYLITAVTMCDIHRSTLTHVTPEVVPPALLIGERDNVSGRDLLVALAAGFEVTTRVGVGSDYPAVRCPPSLPTGGKNSNRRFKQNVTHEPLSFSVPLNNVVSKETGASSEK